MDTLNTAPSLSSLIVRPGTTLAIVAGRLLIVLAMALAAAGCGMQKDPHVTLHPLDPSVFKPGGQEFRFWQNQTVYTRTYHVDGHSLKASDENPGTADLPFKTINRAAEVARPGERVLVHAGLYRECIKPARGGNSASQMIAYQAEGQVIVRGSEPTGTRWIAQGAGSGIWALDLATMNFGDYNPFAMENLPEASFGIMSWATDLRGKPPYTLPRGMVFQDGQRLRRVATRDELLATAGSHWTDRQADQLLVHIADGKDPNGLGMEITARGSCFRPRVRGLGFLEVRGFVFEQVGNGFPRPQEGVISVAGGHHWLIEDNTVRQANGIGIDIGNGWYGGAAGAPEKGRDQAAWNIVRRNRVTDTGVCGIAGYPADNALIEENVLANNTLYPIEKIYECAGIKTHRNRGTLIRRNLIMDNAVNAIWMDWDNRDTRCTQNVIVNSKTGILIEAAVIEPFCLIDRNIVWGTEYGIVEQDCTNQRFVHNLIGHSQVGIAPRGKLSTRLVAVWPWHMTAGGGHTIANNAFVQVQQPIKQTQQSGSPPNTLVGNATEDDGLAASLDVAKGFLTLYATRPLATYCPQCLVTQDLCDRAWPPDNRSPGPWPLDDQARADIRLDWWRK